MKVLLVNGSPHANGCTYTALAEVEKALQEQGIETEIIWIGKEPLEGCRGCAACSKLWKCVVDDKVNEFALKAAEADAKAFCARAKKYELLFVAGDDFGYEGWVRIAYCVQTEQIQRALPLFKKLAEEYGL